MGAAAQRFGLSLSQSPQVLNHFAPLLGLRLHKVRHIYDLLFTQALPASPFVKTPAFLRALTQLSIRQPEQVAAAFTRSPDRRDSVNFLHFVTALTIYSGTHWYYKVKCKRHAVIFAMFDFDESGGITLDELVIMGAAVFTASCAMTGVQSPSSSELNPVLELIFRELQTQQQIQLER